MDETVLLVCDTRASVARSSVSSSCCICLQDINATLAGLTALLKLFAKPTGQLIEDHKTARRAALAAYGSTGNASNGAALGAAGPTGGVYTTGTSSKLQHQQQQQQQYGPLAANRMIAGGAGFAAVSAGPTGSSAEYSPRVTGGSGGGSGGGYSGSPRKGAATAAAAAVQTVMAIAAAGGDVGSQEHVLLKILCHRWVSSVVRLAASRHDWKMHQAYCMHVCCCDAHTK